MTGLMPFHTLESDVHIITAIATGRKLKRKDYYPDSEDQDGKTDKLWFTFASCWETIPENRPNMDAIHKDLDQYLSEGFRTTISGT